MRTESGMEFWQPNFQAPEFRSAEAAEAHLRANGCPEELAKRVVESRFRPGYSRKQPVSGSSGSHPNPSADLAFKIATLRAAARAMGKHLLAIAERDCPNCAGGGDDKERMRMIRGHLDVAGQMLECAASTAETVESIFNGMDEEDDSARMTSPTYQARRKRVREMHRECHRLLGELCLNHASTRLSAAEILD